MTSQTDLRNPSKKIIFATFGQTSSIVCTVATGVLFLGSFAAFPSAASVGVAQRSYSLPAWPKLSQCFSRVSKDRDWTVTYLMNLGPDRSKFEVQTGAYDNTSEENSDLRKAQDELIDCAMDALGPDGNGPFKFSMTDSSQRFGTLDQNQSTVATAPGESQGKAAVKISKSAKSGQSTASKSRVHSDEQPANQTRLAYCVGLPTKTMNWMVRMKIHRGPEFSDPLVWTVSLERSNDLDLQSIDSATRFARCLPAVVGLTGVTDGPIRAGTTVVTFQSGR